PASAMRGDPVTIRATIDPPPGNGSVTFYTGETPMAFNRPVQPDGSAQVTTSFSASDTYQIKACFEGNANYQGGACSPYVPLVVSGLASTTTLTIEPATIYPDESYTIAVTVDPPPEVPASAQVGTTPVHARLWVPIDTTGHGQVTLAY